jgi:hypothetical protein
LLNRSKGRSSRSYSGRGVDGLLGSRAARESFLGHWFVIVSGKPSELFTLSGLTVNVGGHASDGVDHGVGTECEMRRGSKLL